MGITFIYHGGFLKAVSFKGFSITVICMLSNIDITASILRE